MYRLLTAIPTADFLASWQRLLQDDLSQAVTRRSSTLLADLFADGPRAPGSVMAGRAEEGVGDPAQVAASVAFLARDLADGLRS
ncbi:MAG: hypothetical protein Q8P38_12115 [Candidatus Nanopelagicales bacterium]|nr:hypothetical protein [Candidatus Nanopelagicales bacterium]